jgi:hypothetical protein
MLQTGSYPSVFSNYFLFGVPHSLPGDVLCRGTNGKNTTTSGSKQYKQ